MNTDQPPTNERNKAMVRAFHERLWARGDLSVIDEVFRADAVTHWGDAVASSIEAVRSDALRYWAGFTDVETEIGDLIAEGDRVVMRWTTWGTHTGPYGDIPATDRRIEMSGVDIFRVEHLQICEAWSLWDGVEVYRQLGVLPEGL